MTLGTGIFLSALLLAAVLLFAVTKDRWNWRRLAKWLLISPLALVALSVAGIYAYQYWERQPRPVTEFEGIALAATPADVTFIKGEPTSTDGPDRWVYNIGPTGEKKDAAKYLIQFRDGRLRFALYLSSEAQIGNPWLLGFTYGASFRDVEERLGPPSSLVSATDGLDRLYSYERLNAFFSFKLGRLIAYGIYRPELGPMQFRGEKAASAAK